MQIDRKTTRFFVIALILLLTVTLSWAQQAAYNVVDFGAVGDGKTDNTSAIQKAIDSCTENGGGTVLLPAGLYMSKSLYLKDHVNLHLSSGAVLKGSPVLEDYPLEENSPSGESDRAGLLTAWDVNDVSVTGRGVIDGNAMAFMKKGELHWGVNPDIKPEFTRQKENFMKPETNVHGPIAHDERPGNLMRVLNCKHVLVRDVTFRDSPTWTTTFRDCYDVNIEGLTIHSDGSDTMVPNDDGINIGRSRMVRVSNCFIDTGDDCIALHGVKDMTVTNCVFSARSSAIRIGGSFGDTEDILFSNIDFFDTNRALGIFVRSEGSVRNIMFSDIRIKCSLFTGHWWGGGEPIHISALPSTYFNNRRPEARFLGVIENITFRNINIETEAGILIHGCYESVPRNITFDGVRIHMKDGPFNQAVGGNFDLRHTTGFKQALFEHDIPAFYSNMVKNLTVRNMTVTWADTLPDFVTNALYCKNVKSLLLDGVRARQAHLGSVEPAIFLDSVNGVSIRNCKANNGTGTFIQHSDLSNTGLFVQNDLVNAKTALKPEKSNFKSYSNYLP